MSLWNNITQNTARGADLLAYQVSSKAAQLVPDNMPFIKALMGPVVEAQGTPFTTKFLTSTVVQGGKGRIRWQGELPSWSAVTSETAANTIALNADRRGAAEFDLTHYNLQHTISYQEAVFAKGNAQWVDNYMAEESDSVIKALWVKLATDVHSTADQTASSIGSLARALSANDSLGTYLGIARASGGNERLQANVKAVTGITAGDIQDVVDDCLANGGKPDMIVVSKHAYKILRAAADTKGTYNYDPVGKTGFYGARDLVIGGVPVLLDGYCASGYAYVIDSSTWQFQWSDSGLRASDMERAETVRSVYVQNFDFMCGLACRMPRFNGRIDITYS